MANGGEGSGAGSLPRFATPLLGRDPEAGELTTRLTAARLVTLTGPGGIGKTRLAVEVARRTAAGRAHFVDLAPVRDEGLVPERIAAAFGVGELRGRGLAPLVDTVLSGDALLVVDNCEHLTRACATAVRELLAGCPPLRVLATSQQRLGVPAEIEYVVPPLALPRDVEDAAAVRLFCDRAVAAKPDFVRAPGDGAAIADICRRLDANPFAIELAAARVRTLSPAEIASRLERRFQLLRSGPGTTEGRYETLGAALDWSHDLLTGPEKTLLRRLSVFAGTFGFQAVEDVCTGGEVQPDDVLDLLSGVIGKSLVAAHTSGGAARYRLAETVRLYAGQRLADARETAVVGERHVRWAVQVVEGPARSMEELEVEADNVRAALDWCVAHQRAELGLRLATAHMVAWEAAGRMAEARDWLRRLLAIGGGAPASLRARALYHAAFAALLLGDLDGARADVDASLAASAEAGDPATAVDRTNGLSAMVSTLGGRDPGGVEALERRLAEARARDDPHLAEALVGCGHARLFQGEPVAAAAHFAELVPVARDTGKVGPLGAGLIGAGVAALAQGDCRRAREHLREGIAVATKASDVHTGVIGRIWLAELARVTGDAGGARRQLQDGLLRARAMGSPYPLGLALLVLGRADLDDGDPEAARRHLDEALALAGPARLGHVEAAVLERLGEAVLVLGDGASAEELFARALAVAQKAVERTATARATHELAERARVRGDLDRAVALHHDALRRFHEVGVRPGTADALDALAGLAVDRADPARAARLFGAAAALRHAGGWVRRARPHDPYPTDLARLRELMRSDELEAAWAAGAALRCDEAVAYASRGRGPRAGTRDAPHVLTPAEREVVALAVRGLTTDEIAGRLFVSPRTVHSHLRRVYAKLGVGSRRELRQQVGNG